MQKNKILHITQGFGGLYTYIKQIIENIDAEKFTICIIAPYNEECFVYCKKQNIQYEIVEMKRGFAPLSDLKSLFILQRKIRKIKPKLIHVHSAKAGFLGRIAAKWANVRSIYTPHGLSYLSFTGYKRIIFLSLETFCKRYTYKILACSESEKLRCIHELGISDSKIVVISNAIKVTDLRKVKYTHENKIMHVGLIARLTYQKNPLLFVEIANKIHNKYPEIRFSILGAGFHDHLKYEVEKLIELYDLKESFELLQWGSFNNVNEYLESLDVFLMPSVFEGLPFSLLEAMNAGALCITSKCDGCNDVINNKINGFQCMEIDDYVNVMESYIQNPQKYTSIVNNAIEILKMKFDLQIFIKKIEEYYIDTFNKS